MYDAANTAKNNYVNQGNAATDKPAKRSAEASVDDLCKRLSSLAIIADRAVMLADRACGGSPKPDNINKETAPMPPGLIFRLNDAGNYLGSISDRIDAAISRLESFV